MKLKGIEGITGHIPRAFAKRLGDRVLAVEDASVSGSDENRGETHTDQRQSPIGEKIILNSGAVVEKPSAEVIERLQEIDPRVRYFPAPNPEAVSNERRGLVYYRAVGDHVGKQIRSDFEGENVAVRGTVAALEYSFPFFDSKVIRTGEQEEELLPLNDVITILRSGSDNGERDVRVGFISPDGELNVETMEFLFAHYFDVRMETKGTPQDDQVFPVVLVYRPDAFEQQSTHGYNTLKGEPSERLAGIYITDRIT